MEFYRYFRWLSLDIVLGAIIFLHFLADLYELTIPFSVYVALGIAIWLIYTTDHIMDARSSDQQDMRRRFHLTHQKLLIFVSGLLAVIALINVYYLPIEIIRSGAILSAFCVAYLMAVYFSPKLWYKEIVVAIGYAAGIFLVPFTLNDSFGLIDFMLFAQLVVLAAINLLIFSYYDKEKDQKNGFGSVIMKLRSKSVLIINVLIGVLFASTLFFLVGENPFYQSIQLVYLLMSVIFYLIIRLKHFFRQVERFRVVGDAVFFIPVIFLI